MVIGLVHRMLQYLHRWKWRQQMNTIWVQVSSIYMGAGEQYYMGAGEQYYMGAGEQYYMVSSCVYLQLW
jgi:hypothetical protein